MTRAEKVRESANRAVNAEEMLAMERDQKIRQGILHVLRKESSILLRRAVGFWLSLRLSRRR